MLKLSSISKKYREAEALNKVINLFGFIDEHMFLTKSGDLGVVLEIKGIDYECLDQAALDSATKRLELALKLFDQSFRVYQYLFKTNHPNIPSQVYDNEVVREAISNRAQHFKAKADSLYSLRIYYVILLQGSHQKQRLSDAFAKVFANLGHGFAEVRNQLSTDKRVLLIEEEIERACRILSQRVQAFVSQLDDVVGIKLLTKTKSFTVLRRTLNISPFKIEHPELKHDAFLDYYVADSALECHRRHLRIDGYYVKVLTLKEPSSQTFPLVFEKLLEVPANFHVVTEWRMEETAKIKREIQSKRRHFHNSKTSMISQMKAGDAAHAGDLLVDDSKEALVQSLGESNKEIEIKGNYFGEFSLTVVVYAKDLHTLEKACADFYKVFSLHDASVYEESYNLLNAFLATVPGNYHFNFRYMHLLNTNYADYSFLFSPDTGEVTNKHLGREYLAILETQQGTPYFFNLHHLDIAHTLILGHTGSGKSFLLNFLITNLQKYEPYTFIFDLGGSFESLTELFSGSYLKIGTQSQSFRLNPFSLPPTKENIDFLYSFVRVLIEGSGQYTLTSAEEKDLFEQTQNLYEIDPSLRTLSVLARTLERSLGNRLYKWVEGGQYGNLFDNSEDTLNFSRFQCFNFEGMDQYPQLLEPMLFYILHRANAVIYQTELSTSFKAFFMDEAWTFFRHPVLRNYIIESLKTWRKKNAAMIVSTQSLDELRKSGILDVVVESCPTKIFLSNPGLDGSLYRETFHLNEREVELILSLIPKQQFLVKRPDAAKVLNLTVDPKSYWLYTNDPYDNQKRREAFDQHGLTKGLEILANQKRSAL